VLEPTISSQLAEAASLMLVGMAVVFVFLTLLIVAVNGLSWLCSKLPQSDILDTTSTTQTNTPTTNIPVIPAHHIAAITAAFAAKNKNKSTK
jgi:oxaloacetate decarboxylase gamma subunit